MIENFEIQIIYIKNLQPTEHKMIQSMHHASRLRDTVKMEYNISNQNYLSLNQSSATF